MQTIRLEKKKHQKPQTVVLVTNQFQCERIIKAGKRVADLTMTDLFVISVSDPQYPQNPQALEHLFQVSQLNGAMMTVFYSDDPQKTIKHYLKENRVENAITGLPRKNNSLLYAFWQKFTSIRFFTVTQDGELQEVVDRKEHITA